MKGGFFRAFSLAVVVLLVAVTASAQGPNAKSPEPLTAENSQAVGDTPTVSTSPAVYIIRLEDAPLATYQGGVAGLAPTSPAATGAAKLDANSPASVAYRDYLADKQDQLLATMEQELGHAVEVLFRYDVAYNGLAVRLSGQEAARIAGLPGVVDVQREKIEVPVTDVGPAWIGAPSIWDGSAVPGGMGTMGEGVIVGVIDTGINSDHPSFADVGDDGYDHTNPFGAGTYVGYCVANPGFCNDKLIGAWTYVTEPTTPEDSDGHGSHTSSTAAGNVISATKTTPSGYVVEAQISGVAPHANLIMYDACVTSCPSSGLLAAANQAVADGVDVINYSISGGADPYNDPVELAFLGASAAGVFVSTSAGNEGPGANTVGHRSPWVATVAAATHNKLFVNALVNLSGGTTPPGDIVGQSITTGYGPAPIVYAGDYGDALCLTPFPAGTWTNGEIVVCDRGIAGRVEKGINVAAGGAGGYVLANDEPSGNSLVADAHALPAVHITYQDGLVLKAWLASGTGHTATIAGTTEDLSAANGDIMASFSSRGPNTTFDVLKPDLTAPGVAIFAAYLNGVELEWLGGTSMASPHNAGAGALLTALYPSWTPAEIKSALMTTAVTSTLREEDGTTPADPFDVGAGRDDLTGAAMVGLVFDETTANYQAADPALGGDPKTLNLPSLVDSNCMGTCSWSRTVSSTLDTAATWAVSVAGAPPGLIVTVTPGSLDVPAGGTASFDVSVDVTGFNAAADGRDGWGFAQIVLESPGQEPLHLPLAVQKDYSSNPLLLTKQAGDTTALPGQILQYTITITNMDSVTNTYFLTDTLPAGVDYVDGSATGGLVYDEANHRLQWTGEIGPGSIEYTVTEVDPLFYVNLGDLGAPELCTTYFMGACDDVVLSWDISPYSFTYYGESLAELNQSSNSMIFGPEGWLGTACSACNQHLPEPTEINQVIAGLWRDTDMSGGNGAFYGSVLTGLLPNPADAVFYANWHGAAQFGDPTITTTHAIALVLDGQSEPAGTIYYIYEGISGDLTTNGYTVGVEDKLGLEGTTYAFSQCSGGPCIPHDPVGTPPAEGITLRLDPVVAGTNNVHTFTYQVQVSATVGTVLTNLVEVTSTSPDPAAQQMWASADVTVGGTQPPAVTVYLPVVYKNN